MSNNDVEVKQENSTAVVILGVIAGLATVFGFGMQIPTLAIVGGISLALTISTAAILTALRNLR